MKVLVGPKVVRVENYKEGVHWLPSYADECFVMMEGLNTWVKVLPDEHDEEKIMAFVRAVIVLKE